MTVTIRRSKSIARSKRRCPGSRSHITFRGPGTRQRFVKNRASARQAVNYLPTRTIAVPPRASGARTPAQKIESAGKYQLLHVFTDSTYRVASIERVDPCLPDVAVTPCLHLLPEHQGALVNSRAICGEHVSHLH